MQASQAFVNIHSTDGPYATYHQWRSVAPIVWSDELFGGAWLITSYAGVEAALKDARLSAKRTGGWVMRPEAEGTSSRRPLIDMQRLFSRAMLFLDRPDHTRLRKLMQLGFRPSLIEALQPYVDLQISLLMNDVETRFQPGETFDFIEVVAKKLPTRVIGRLLGIDESLISNDFHQWCISLAKFIGAANPSLSVTMEARRSLLSMASYFREIFASGAKNDSDDLLGIMFRAERSGQIRDATELISQCAMLLFAGHETTRHFLGTSLFWLLRWRQQWEALVADPRIVKSAVRELLRWDSPVQYTGRRATCSFELYGQKITRGELVMPILGAANRDPSKYQDPNNLDIARPVGFPLSFGSGPHVCIGATLTLMEAESLLRHLAIRWPNIALSSDTPDWIPSPLYRGFNSLPVMYKM